MSNIHIFKGQVPCTDIFKFDDKTCFLLPVRQSLESLLIDYSNIKYF